MSTCITVSALKTFIDGLSAVTTVGIITLDEEGAHLHARDPDRDICVSALLRVAVEGAGCAKVHIPTFRGVLKLAPPKQNIQIVVTPSHTELTWGMQSHSMPHLRLTPTGPILQPFKPLAVFKSNNALECLKFCRDVSEDEILFKGDGCHLYVTNPGDLCVSSLKLLPSKDVLEHIVGAGSTQTSPFEITCQSDVVQVAARGSAFAPMALVAVGRRSVLFHFDRPDGYISILIPCT